MRLNPASRGCPVWSVLALTMSFNAHLAISGEVWCVAGTSTSTDPRQAGRSAAQKAREAMGDRKPGLVLVYDAFGKENKQVVLDILAETFDRQIIYGCGAREAAIGPDTSNASLVVAVFGGDIQVASAKAAVAGNKWSDVGKALGEGLKSAYEGAAKAKGRVVLLYFDGNGDGNQILTGLTEALGKDARIAGGAQGPVSFQGKVAAPGAVALVLSGEFTCGFGMGTGHLGEHGKETHKPEDILRSATEAASAAVGKTSDVIALIVASCISRRDVGDAELKTLKQVCDAPIVGFWAEGETGCAAPDKPASTKSYHISICALCSTAPPKVAAPIPHRETAVVLDSQSPRAKLLDELGLSLTPNPDVLQALTDDKFGLVVADAAPAALKALAEAPDRVKAFHDRGGWLVLWGLTPEGLADFNKLVGVEHLLRPHTMENVQLPINPDPLLKGLDGINLVMYGNKKGMQGIPLQAEDVWSFVLDYDDIAPFSKFPDSAYWEPKAAELGTDHYAPNMVNGFDESWQLGFTIPITKPEYLKWTFTFPRAEEVTGFSFVPDNIYHVITKLRLSFEGSDAKPMDLDVKPDLLRQHFDIPSVKTTGLTLEILQMTDNKAPVTGVRNLSINVKRSNEFRQKVKPLLNRGVLMKYPVGQGGIVVNQMQILDKEIVPENRNQLRAILTALMRNLGANRLAVARVPLGNASDWPQWRGPNRNNTSPETGLALNWDQTPPTELWRTNVGRGISSVIAAGDNVYMTGCDLLKGEDAVWCLDADSGRVVWRHSFPCDLPAEYGAGGLASYPSWAGTHATPTVNEGRLYSISQDGLLLCLDAATGRLLWRRAGCGRGSWGYQSSPLIVGDDLILEEGLTLDKVTGEVLWKGVGNPKGVCSSPVHFVKDGKDCVLVESPGSFTAFTLPDFKPFWKVFPGASGEDVIDPTVLGERVMFWHQNKPTRLANIGAEKTDEVWNDVVNGYDNPILFDGYFYSNREYLSRSYQCYDAKNGTVKWTVKPNGAPRPGILLSGGPTFSIMAEGKLIAQDESGMVVVIQASPDSPKLLGSYNIRANQRQQFYDACWTTPALSHGRLFCRTIYGDVVALDVRSIRPPPQDPPALQDGRVRKWVRSDMNMAGRLAVEGKFDNNGRQGVLIRSDRNRDDTPVSSFQKPESSDWVQWRGPNRNGIGEKTATLDWTLAQPRELWRVDAGLGFSAPVVAGDRLYSMGWYEDAVPMDRVTFYGCMACLDIRTGRTIWKFHYAPKANGWIVDVDRDGRHAFTCTGPRATPALDEGRLYALDQAGEAFCLDAENGNVIWRQYLMQGKPQGARPKWFFSGSPLVLDKVVVVAFGASGIALDKATGAIVWTSGDEACGNASPVHFQQAGQERLAIFGKDRLFTMEANTGKTLWQYPWADGAGANRCDPIVTEDNKVFVFGGRGKGAALLTIGEDKPIWEQKALDPLMGTPILYQDHLYGPSQSQKALVCLNASDGSVQWREPMDATQLTLVDGKFIVQCRNGEVRLAEAAPAGFKSFGKFQALEGNECWTPPVVSRGRLFCRSWSGELAAFDLATLIPFVSPEQAHVTDELLSNLGSRLQSQRELAIAKLATVSNADVAKLNPLLVAKLRKGAWFEQTSSFQLFQKLGAAASGAAPELIAVLNEMLKAHNWTTAKLAFDTLNAVDSATAQSGPAIVAALEDQDGEVRMHALQLIAPLTAPPQSIVDAVVALLSDKDIALARAAVGTLSGFGPAAKPAVPVLLELLRIPGMQLPVIGALANIGPAAKSSIPDMIALSKVSDTNEQTRTAIQAAIAAIDPASLPENPSAK